MTNLEEHTMRGNKKQYLVKYIGLGPDMTDHVDDFRESHHATYKDSTCAFRLSTKGCSTGRGLKLLSTRVRVITYFITFRTPEGALRLSSS